MTQPWSKDVLFSSAKQDWSTPKDLFTSLDSEFSFDLDACATSANAKTLNFIGPEEDALTVDWSERGARIFCNPPYGRGIGEWVEKAYKTSLSGPTVVVLIFARTDTKWWQDWASRAAEIRFISGRVHFERGGLTGPATAPSAVLVFSEEYRVPLIKHVQLPRGND